ncbi:Zinc-binding dehydrogenase [Colletotrichum higginsianum IMI 349063]|uniref:Zinc-binding dehydrogenase n=2 Tax=Colletotrichum higginsianum (strain IMI 349063) TaxID=759273 RepID=A0A1B7YKT7_COLHI|nr:Zinc-binding dehydrogenase [Colletotrichum higginsianum IMI 349063]OBR12663.1 Zinc-binding dehydrogenase [Colletotrichum higginsianum IMI 349063]
MSETMRAVDIKEGKGPKENLFINPDVLRPIPGDGEVLVKVKAFGINRMDTIQRLGDYPLPPQAPNTLGVEFSGTIHTFGTGNHGDFKQDDEVFGLAYGGAYAEFIAVNHQMLLHKPASLTWEQAAGIPETWITATQALFLVGEFTAGKTVLWHAGMSGVSIAGIQLAKDAGAAAVYATAGSPAKCEFVVREIGATAAFNYKTQDWVTGIKEATNGKGVDIIIDFIGGGGYFQKNLDVAARDAHIVQLGLLGGSKVDGADIEQLLYKRIRIQGSTLRSREIEYQGKLRDRLEEYIPHFETGDLKVVIDTVLPWEEIQKAHGLLEANSTSGKIVCTIS